MEAPKMLDYNTIKVESYSSAGGKSKNEDSCIYCQYAKNLVCVLADGLGGHGEGQIASKIVCEQLISCGSDNNEVTKDVLIDAFDRANDRILEEKKQSGYSKYQMKTTAVYLCISHNRAIWANIGDSRLLHFFNGKLEHYTLDHSVAQTAVYLEEITREEIPSYPGRSKIYHALGEEGEKLTAVKKISLVPGNHAFLLCSDGVWERIPEKKLEAYLSESHNAEDWIRLIIEEIEDHITPSCDNHSAIAITMNV